MSIESKYKNFVKYYGEIRETIADLVDKADSFSFDGKPVPWEIESELFRHKFIIELLDEIAKDQFGKEPTEVINELNSQ